MPRATVKSAALTRIENSYVANGPSGLSELKDLRSALLELRGELVKKQSELLAAGLISAGTEHRGIG